MDFTCLLSSYLGLVGLNNLFLGLVDFTCLLHGLALLFVHLLFRFVSHLVLFSELFLGFSQLVLGLVDLVLLFLHSHFRLSFRISLRRIRSISLLLSLSLGFSVRLGICLSRRLLFRLYDLGSGLGRIRDVFWHIVGITDKVLGEFF